MTRSTPIDNGPEPLDDGGFRLIPLLTVIATHKKVLFGFPFAAALVAAAVSLVVPDVYRASTKVLPAQQARPSAAALLSQFIGVVGPLAGATPAQRSNDLFAEMLASRNVEDALITQFDLVKVYRTDTREKAREKLEENTFIRAGREGLISIEVEDGDPQRAANLANAYSDQLLRLTRELALAEASQRRIFFEKQFQLVKSKLSGTEQQLGGALDARGMRDVEAAGGTMVATIGELTAQIFAKEAELAAMRGSMTPSNPAYVVASEALSGMRLELSKLESGRAAGGARSALPGPDSVSVLRDVKSQQALYELRAAQYEVARLDEANPPSDIHVLDRAVAPQKRLRPKRALIVSVSTFYAMCGAIFWVFLAEVIARARWTPDGALRWEQLKSNLRVSGMRHRS